MSAARAIRPERAVARFHFHVTNGFGVTEDEEGRELASLDEARREAIKGVRSIVSEEVKEGRLDLGGRIDVADPAGRVLLTIAFTEAVQVVNGELPPPGS
jgi:hypothetical protein